MISIAKHFKSWRSVALLLCVLLFTVFLSDLLWLSLYPKDKEQDAWISLSFELIEQELKSNQASDFEALSLPYDIQINSLAEVHFEEPQQLSSHSIQLIELNGQNFYIKNYLDLNKQVLVGPLPKQSSWQAVFSILFYVLLALILWWWLQPILTGLERLRLAMMSFARDCDQKLELPASREPIASMQHSFEQMAEQISWLIRSQQELTRGLSHELRTPLARAKFVLAELNQANAQAKPLYDSLAEDLQEIELLTSAMLDYSRIGAATKLDRNELRLIDLLEQVRDQCSWRASAKISVQCDPELFASMDALLIKLALSNLVFNAARFAQASIVIEAELKAGQLCISVCDDGPGLSDIEKQQLVLPFARKAGQQDMGFGLGLPTVLRIVQLHGGTMTLYDSSIGGLNVQLCLPKEI